MNGIEEIIAMKRASEQSLTIHLRIVGEIENTIARMVAISILLYRTPKKKTEICNAKKEIIGIAIIPCNPNNLTNGAESKGNKKRLCG